jgi:cytosine/uracil/thiamine/allantoin permease
MLNQKLMWIAWPAFLGACALELIVFAMVDPGDLHWSGEPLGLSRKGVYTAAFFVFWAICLVSSALTNLLGMSSAEVNRCPVLPGDRPDNCRPQ